MTLVAARQAHPACTRVRGPAVPAGSAASASARARSGAYWNEMSKIIASGFGLEASASGYAIGRDPRMMTQAEIRALGHDPMSPMQAIRAHCLDCCGGAPAEVRACVAVRCPSWPFRMGRNP